MEFWREGVPPLPATMSTIPKRGGDLVRMASAPIREEGDEADEKDHKNCKVVYMCSAVWCSGVSRSCEGCLGKMSKDV